MAFEQEKTEADIVAAAEKITKGQRYEVWTVGTTDNVDLRHMPEFFDGQDDVGLGGIVEVFIQTI